MSTHTVHTTTLKLWNSEPTSHSQYLTHTRVTHCGPLYQNTHTRRTGVAHTTTTRTTTSLGLYI